MLLASSSVTKIYSNKKKKKKKTVEQRKHSSDLSLCRTHNVTNLRKSFRHHAYDEWEQNRSPLDKA